MKRDLIKICGEDVDNTNETLTQNTPCKRKSSTLSECSRVYESKCIFCQKTSKYQKGKDTRELLTQCVDLRSDETVRKAATEKLDSRILAIVSREMVAAEALYHRSCYQAYTKK